MKFSTPTYQIIDELDPYKQIESAGRTCYQSEAKEGDTEEAFFHRLISRKHFAMTEFAHFVFCVHDDIVWSLCKESKYLDTTEVDGRRIVSGNLRAFNECDAGIPLLKIIIMTKPKLRSLCYSIEYTYTTTIDTSIATSIATLIEPEDEEKYLITTQEIIAHSYLAVRLVTCRGVTHEIVRNRPFSFAQESTRYVKYGKNGEPMLFMLPPWIQGNERDILLSREWRYDTSWSDNKAYQKLSASSKTFVGNLICDEVGYGDLLDLGWKPQEARELLPNALKTEIVIKGPISQWLHFFYLRCDKPAHPQMREWTIPLYNQLRSKDDKVWGSIASKIDLS